MILNIAERHKLILKKLEENGFVDVADLSREFDVSLVTIRKDLKVLEQFFPLFLQNYFKTKSKKRTSSRNDVA